MNRAYGLLRLFIFFVSIVWFCTDATAAVINATTCSQANVATAIASASAGDTVQVPAGTCSWTGHTITGIRLIGAGKSTSGTVITGGSVTITKHVTEVTRLSGFRFTGTSNHVTFGGSVSNKPFVIDNCYFFTNGGAGADRMMIGGSNGGVLHHNEFTATTGTGADVFNIATGETDWSQPTTIGNEDTTGERNLYFEDNVFTNILETMPDADTGTRLVMRHNTFVDSSIVLHSSDPNDTGPTGGGHRHTEIYNNTFDRVSNAFPINKWIWVRGGTGVFANNAVENADSPDGSSYPNKPEITFTIGCPTAYPIAYQVGQDTIPPDSTPNRPFAIFGNTGVSLVIGIGSGPVVTCGSPSTYIQAGRDYVTTNTWGWTPYTYPHPLAATSNSPTATITAPTSGTTYSTGTSPLTTLAGTAADDVAVTSVTWSCDVCGSGTATGTTSWSVASITLQTGANVITVTAHDGESQTGNDVLTVTLTGNAAPAITITAPTSNPTLQTVTTPLTTLAGTASDDVSVSSVTWACPTCTPTSGTATGTTSWSVSSIGLAVGANVITVTASDGTLTANDVLTVTYSVAAGCTYYVDNTAGNDANNGTSPGTAWQRSPGMAAYTGSGTLVAGNTVCFDSADTWSLTSGNQGIALVGGVTYLGNNFGSGTKATLLANADFIPSSTAGAVVVFADHATQPTVFEGFDVNANNRIASGIGINYPFYSLKTGAVKRIKGNIVRNVGGSFTSGWYTYGIIVTNNGGTDGTVANVEIIGNVVHDIARDGICLYPSDTTGVPGGVSANIIQTILVQGNEVYNTGNDPSYGAGAGLLIKGRVIDATLEYNYAHTTKGSTIFLNGNETNHGSGMSNIHIRYNIIDKSNTSTQANLLIYDTSAGDPKDVKIYGNIFLPSAGTLGGLYKQNVNTITLLVYNNTFYQSWVNFTNTADTPTVTFTNNLIYYTGGVPFSVEAAGVSSHSDNIYYRGSGTLVAVGGTTYTAATLGTYEATASSADPLFTNASSLPTGFSGSAGTFTPNTTGLSTQAGSFARINGLALASPYNNSINSTIRSSGTWDIGAYQMTVVDITNPTVSITAPSNNTLVVGTNTSVTADASDNVGVMGVQFKLDGANLGAEDTTSTYGITWDTTTTFKGTHTLTATARDAAGNTATSSGITVTVANNPTGITVTWTEPTASATLAYTTVYWCAGIGCTEWKSGVEYRKTSDNGNGGDVKTLIFITPLMLNALPQTYRFKITATDTQQNETSGTIVTHQYN